MGQQPAEGEARHRSQEELMQLVPAAAPAEPPVNGQRLPLVADATAPVRNPAFRRSSG